MPFRNKYRKSSTFNVWEIHKYTALVNVQEDQFSTTREALSQIHFSDESYLIEKLATQSLLIKPIWEHVDGKYINRLPNAVSHFPRRIYNFAVQYLSSKLSNGTIAIKWGITNSFAGKFFDEQQTLVHAITEW